MAYVEFRKVKKQYRMGEVTIDALRDITFEIEKGEICVIVGASPDIPPRPSPNTAATTSALFFNSITSYPT